jgi:ribosome-binding factor A
MPSHRVERVAEAIREVASTAILFQVADPRVKGVTVLRAEVTGDLRNATVFVTVMGTESQQRLAMNGLRHAAGFIQARVAARLQTRFTPALQFKIDEGVKRSVEISRLIDEAIASDRAAHPAPEGEAVADDDERDDETDDLDEDEAEDGDGDEDGEDEADDEDEDLDDEDLEDEDEDEDEDEADAADGREPGTPPGRP